MQKIVVIGASVIDVILKSDSFKVIKSHEVEMGVALCEVLGGKTDAQSGVISTGGGGSNVAVGLRRLGESVKIVSRVGDDDFGRILKSDLDREMVDIGMLKESPGMTGFSSVLVAENGARSIVTFRGESANFRPEDVDWKTIEKADWVQLSSLGGNIDLLEDIVTFCHQKGIRVGANPGIMEIESKHFLQRVLPKLNLLSLNRQEASILSGIEFEREKEMMVFLSGFGLGIVAVSDGKRGASVIRNGKWIKMEAFKNGSVDDTGAGDAFVVGIVDGFINNKSIEDCLKMGIANGSNVVSFMGAKRGLLRQEEMKKKSRKKLMVVEEVL